MSQAITSPTPKWVATTTTRSPRTQEKVVVCMADVSGKGMSAALLMSNFQAHVRALFQAEHTSLVHVAHPE